MGSPFGFEYFMLQGPSPDCLPIRRPPCLSTRVQNPMAATKPNAASVEGPARAPSPHRTALECRCAHVC
jgi:hypothetical protein